MKQRYLLAFGALILAFALSLPCAALTVDELAAGVTSASPDERISAINQAASVGSAAVAPLAAHVDSDHFYAAKSARKALAVLVAHAGGPDSPPEERGAVADELVKLLDTGHPEAVRREAVRLLDTIAEGRHVPAIAKLLEEEDLAQDACQTLERIPGAAAEQALIDGLYLAPPPLRVTLMAALARRDAKQAMPALIAEAKSDNPDVAWAAFDALTAMGVPPTKIRPRSRSFSREEDVHYTRGLLEAAHKRAEQGDTAAAERFYASVAAFPATPGQACVAISGLARIDSELVVQHALGYLSEPAIRAAAVDALATAQVEGLDDLLIRAYEKVAPANQAALLRVLSAREAEGADALIAQAIDSGNPSLKFRATLLAGKTPSVELLRAAVQQGAPWIQSEAAPGLIEHARQAMDAGKIEDARAMAETVAVSRAGFDARAEAFRIIRDTASAASAPLAQAIVERLGPDWRKRYPEAFAEAAGTAAVAVFGAVDDAGMAKEGLMKLTAAHLPEAVVQAASGKLTELGVPLDSAQ